MIMKQCDIVQINLHKSNVSLTELNKVFGRPRVLIKLDNGAGATPGDVRSSNGRHFDSIMLAGAARVDGGHGSGIGGPAGGVRQPLSDVRSQIDHKISNNTRVGAVWGADTDVEDRQGPSDDVLQLASDDQGNHEAHGQCNWSGGQRNGGRENNTITLNNRNERFGDAGTTAVHVEDHQGLSDGVHRQVVGDPHAHDDHDSDESAGAVRAAGVHVEDLGDPSNIVQRPAVGGRCVDDGTRGDSHQHEVGGQAQGDHLLAPTQAKKQQALDTKGSTRGWYRADTPGPNLREQ